MEEWNIGILEQELLPFTFAFAFAFAFCLPPS
jgi:hypothetical protein